MKLNNIKYWTLAAILGANLVSCDDFLDRLRGEKRSVSICGRSENE